MLKIEIVWGEGSGVIPFSAVRGLNGGYYGERVQIGFRNIQRKLRLCYADWVSLPDTSASTPHVDNSGHRARDADP